MKLIDLEAHFLTRAFADYLAEGAQQQANLTYDKLFDLGDGRLRHMDEAGIDVQVLSLFQLPHIQRLESAAARTWARSTNEALAATVEKQSRPICGIGRHTGAESR